MSTKVRFQYYTRLDSRGNLWCDDNFRLETQNRNMW